jgi:hypothetical protein
MLDRSPIDREEGAHPMPTIRANPTGGMLPHPTLEEIAALVGGDDATVHTAILATGASLAEIEQAMIMAAGAGEALGEAPHPLEGRVAAVYEILTAEEADEEG